MRRIQFLHENGLKGSRVEKESYTMKRKGQQVRETEELQRWQACESRKKTKVCESNEEERTISQYNQRKE